MNVSSGKRVDLSRIFEQFNQSKEAECLKKINSQTKSSFYIRKKYTGSKTGKQRLALYLSNRGLIETHKSLLPDDNTIFFWIQREYVHPPKELFSGNERAPCIAFIPSQGILCEKVEFAHLLSDYYGDSAWQITPKTFCCHWNESTKSWTIPSDLAMEIKSFPSNRVWITKSNFGCKGQGIAFYRGNSVNSFRLYLNQNHTKHWNKLHETMSIAETSTIQYKALVVQHYVDRPLLFNDHYKFDLRVYALIVTTNPCVLLYHIGKMRVCGVKYTDLSGVNDDEAKTLMKNKKVLSGQISNSSLQRKRKQKHEQSHDELVDWNGFIQFLYEIAIKQKRFRLDWFEQYQYLYNGQMDRMTMEDLRDLIDLKCRRLLSFAYDAAKDRFDADSVEYDRPCQFVFHGADIMLDENGRFYLIEINRCPTLLSPKHASILKMGEQMLEEMVDICLEIREMKLNGEHVDQDTPLESLHFWQKCRLAYHTKAVQKVDEMIRCLDTMLKK